VNDYPGPVNHEPDRRPVSRETELPELRRDRAAYDAMDARRRELARLSAHKLEAMHRAANKRSKIDHSKWTRETLINAVLEDEGHLWHPPEYK
jgi:hypothetical protein